MDPIATRRELIAAPLFAGIAGLAAQTAFARPLDPEQTIIKPPEALVWTPNPRYPERSSDTCNLTGAPTSPGLYYTLIRWWPGFMSAPHTYTSDRYCMVLSGTWWCNSGEDFDPASCVPVKAGSFVRLPILGSRRARAKHRYRPS